MTLAETERTFVPGMGRDWLLPLYDPLTRLLGLDGVRRAVIGRAELRPGHRVLDIGCGTGSLAILVRRLHPGVEVVGLDPDERALARARRKARRAEVGLQLDWGFADRLPYPDESYDRVFSSFMLHHLGRDEKEGTLAEVRRVLRPGGRFHLVDFASPHAAPHARTARALDSYGRLNDNTDGRILELLETAGLAKPAIVGRKSLLAGRLRIACYEASVSAR